MDDEEILREFLAELGALEKLRISYTGLYKNVPLAREDPDVRRLIEAMAFFSARTRVAASRTVNESLVRLFQQHFPYALSPMPAMALLRANVTAGFPDAVSLPRGVEVLIDRKAAPPTRPPKYRFRTAAPLRVLPIELKAVQTFPVREQGHRILLRFTTAFPRAFPIGSIALHVNHLNDLLASMTVYYALKTHLRRASVIYERVIDERTEGARCRVRFGADAAAPRGIEAFEVPVQRFRSFLHFPQAELFVHVEDIAHQRNWQEFCVCLDVDAGWPAELRLTPDTFALHTAPMLNIKRDAADPIECDGTQERYLVRHPDDASRFVPHSIAGVFQMTPQGMAPLEPGVLGPTTRGYEISFEGEGEARRAWVSLDLPGAFEAPQRVSVEAYWTQPDIAGLRAEELDAALAAHHEEQLRVRLADRHVEGLGWSCEGAIVPPASSGLENNRDELVTLMSLKSLRFLALDELTFLLRTLGARNRPEFAKLTSSLASVELDNKPAAKKAGGVCHVYTLRFDNLDTSDLPVLDLFCAQLLALLEAWSIEQVTEIVALAPRLKFERRFAR